MNNTTKKHTLYMRRCFDLARLGAGQVKSNPMVGAVVVYKDKIIGEGYHERYGEGHAEVNAIKSVKEQDLPLLSQSTIYVSLEPCFHFGKTPPCVNLILQHKIPRVVISCIDPNPKVAGQSIEKLKAAGVEVVTGILEKEGQQLIRRFITAFTKKRPHIILKYAQSPSGIMGSYDRQLWFTTPLSKRLTHRWRSEECAILVGKNTVLIDNPKLNNRHWYGNSPIKIIIDKKLEIKNCFNIFAAQAKTIIVFDVSQTTPKSNKKTLYLPIKFDENFLSNLLKELYQLKIKSLIIEGGAKTLESFILADLWDEAQVFIGQSTQPNPKEKIIIAPKINCHKLINEHKINSDKLCIYVNK